MVTWFVVSCCCLFAPDDPAAGSTPPDGVQAAAAAAGGGGAAISSERPYHEIQADLRAALRTEASRATPTRDWAVAVVRLALLYGELMQDERLARSDTLAGYRVKIRSRLLAVQESLERDLPHAQAPTDGTRDKPADLAAWQRDATGKMQLSWGHGHADSLAGQLDSWARGSGAGGAARSDYGPLLVELIRRTISPEFWDVHGGPGVIIYYQPGHALVIRATPEIHERIGGALGGARD
jgi:hypothetical protein